MDLALNRPNPAATTWPASYLLAARLLSLYALHPDFWGIVRPNPQLPAFSVMQPLTNVPSAMWLVVPAVYVVATLALWLDIRSCQAAFVCGFIVLFDVASNLPEYSNNRILVGLVLVLLSLHDDRLGLWPIRIQLSLVYAGAALNKLFDSDWRSGEFMEHFMLDVLDVQVYGALADSWPWIHQTTTIATIAIETALALAFLIPRHTRFAIAASVVFHGGMLVVTEGALSWLFAYAVGATLLVFSKSGSKSTVPYLGAALLFWVVKAIVA